MNDTDFKQLVAETMACVLAGHKIPKKLNARWPKGCRDCGETDNEYFMANRDVWIKANKIGTAHGVLCVACFEKRLERPLRDDDIGPITDEDDEDMTVSEWRQKQVTPAKKL